MSSVAPVNTPWSLANPFDYVYKSIPVASDLCMFAYVLGTQMHCRKMAPLHLQFYSMHL